MNQESSDRNNRLSNILIFRTLFMAFIFGLLGLHWALYGTLVLLYIATPSVSHYIIAKPLYDEMITPGEYGFKSIGGLIGRLGGIHDALVFVPFLLLLILILLGDYIRKRPGEQQRGDAANDRSRKVNFPTVFFAIVLIVVPALSFYLFRDNLLAISASSSLIIAGSLFVPAIFFRVANRELGQASKRGPLKYTLVMLVSAFLLYGFIYMFSETVLDGVFTTYSITGSWHVLFVVGAFCSIALFILIGEGGVISVLAGEKRGFLSASLRGLVAVLLFSAVMVLMKKYGVYFHKTIPVMLLGDAGEVTRLGFRRLTWIYSVGLGIPLAMMGGVFTAMIPKRVGRGSRLLAVAVPVVLLVVFLGGGEAFKSHCRKVWEIDKDSLSEAASLIRLPEPPPSRIALLLQDVKLEVGSEVKIRGEFGYTLSKEMDLIPENITRIGDYLNATRGRWTYLTSDAMEGRRLIAASHWLVEELRKISLENSLNKGSILNSLLLLRSIDHAPVTPKNRHILKRLSDERLFLVRGKSCLRMAKAWVAMGEIEMAKGFYECAKKSLTEKDLNGFSLPEEPGFTEGKVMGRIKGEVTKGARVGICYLGEIEKPEDVSLSVHGAWRVKAAKDLMGDGSFSFEHIPEGRYLLGLLLKGGVPGPFDIEGGGVIVIDQNRPVADMGDIKVVKSPPGSKPRKRKRISANVGIVG